MQVDELNIKRIPRARILGAYLYAQNVFTPSMLYRKPAGGWPISLYEPALRRYAHLDHKLLLAQGLLPQTVTVPNVVGLSQSVASGIIGSAGLAFGSVTLAYSSSVALGLVISQNPAAGLSVLTGTSVALVVSQGAQLTVPNVVGMTSQAAIALLTSDGFINISSSTTFSQTIAAGVVISVIPIIGTPVSSTDPIALLVSSGPQGGTGIMPNLIGLPYDEAELALEQAGILVLKALGYFSTWPVTYIWVPSSQAPSIVVKQSVSPGQNVSINAPITLTVSEFPVSVAAP